MNFSFLLRLAACRMRSSACDASTRFRARNALCWLAFPSVPALGSAGSAADCPALFVGLKAPIARADLLLPIRHRLRLLAFPMRPDGATSPPDKQEISRFPREELEHMPGSKTTPGRAVQA